MFLSDDVQEKEDAQISGEFPDNRAIVDDNKAQSLSGEDIDEMRRWVHDVILILSFKSLFLFFFFGDDLAFDQMLVNFSCRQGATGEEIVEALIANSATFEKKTSFSQVSLSNIWSMLIMLLCEGGLIFDPSAGEI